MTSRDSDFIFVVATIPLSWPGQFTKDPPWLVSQNSLLYYEPENNSSLANMIEYGRLL